VLRGIFSTVSPMLPIPVSGTPLKLPREYRGVACMVFNPLQPGSAQSCLPIQPAVLRHERLCSLWTGERLRHVERQHAGCLERWCGAQDVFLRELVSNAADACDKKRFLAVSEGKGAADDLEVLLLLSSVLSLQVLEGP